MRYQQQRHTPLDDSERRRLAILARVHHRMALGDDEHLPATEHPDVGQRTVQRMTDGLCELLDNPVPEQSNRDMLQWAIRYGTEAIVSRVQAGLDAQAWNVDALRILHDTDPQHRLAAEHTSPSVQQLDTDNPPPAPRTLICFTGNHHHMMLPLRAFHRLAAPHFDRLIYLRDHSRRRFCYGVAGIATDLPGLGDWLQERIKDSAHLAIVACSAGAVAANQLAAALGCQRMLLFSPEFRFRGWRASAWDAPSIDAKQARLYFCVDDAYDAALLKDWRSSGLARAVQRLPSDSHNSVQALYRAGRLQELLRWLAGSVDAGISCA